MCDNQYRVGNHQPQNLYRGDTYIGVMFDPTDTAWIVKVMNSEKVEAQPGRTETYHVDYAEPRSLYRGGTFLGVLFAEEDAAQVTRALNVVAQL